MFAAACMGCQRPVYTVHVVGHIPDGITYEHEWQFIVASHLYGLEQYSYWVDPQGVTIADPGHEKQYNGTKRTYTVIYLNGRGYTVHARAWTIIALSVAGLGLGLWATALGVNAVTGRRLIPDKDSAAKAE